MTEKKTNKKKTQTFGGVRISSVSPLVMTGKGVNRKEAKVYNFKLSFDDILKLQHSAAEAASYLSKFHESSKAFKNGVRLVINFETGRIDFQKRS